MLNTQFIIYNGKKTKGNAPVAVNVDMAKAPRKLVKPPTSSVAAATFLY